jgi:hypothetical protein
MKFSFFTMILLIIVTLSLNANNLSLIENTDANLVLHFQNDNPQNNPIDLTTLSQSGGFTENIITNNYNLPVVSCMIQVPAHMKPVVTLVNPKYSTKEGVKLSKIDEDISVNTDFAMVSAPFVMRSSLLSTLSVQTQVYDAATSQLKTLLEADVKIDFVPDNTFTAQSSIRQTKEFKTWLSKTVINYNDESRSGDANGSLLIVYNPSASALSIIQPLIDWKHQKGWEVHAVSTTVAGTNTNTIKNYIQNAYDTWTNPPEYILMLGRVTPPNNVPTYSEFYNYNTVGDYKYTLLDGDDIIPDAYIGRLTFSSSDQLTTMINKIIAYEKKQGLTNSNWYNANLLLSDETDSGPSCTTNIDYVRDLILTYNPTASITYVNSGAYPSEMSAAINAGVGNYYYRGHNGYSGMTNSDVSNLINTGRYPFLCFITCFSGNYGQQSQLSIGEQFMRIGTSSNPKGAIGFIGAACETHTCLNNIMTGAVAYGFYREGLTNQGQAEVRAKLGLLACYPQYPDDYIPQNFQSVNLLGDPTIDIWLKQPTNITVTFPTTLALANGNMQVTVVDAGNVPVENAKVCLLKGADEVFQVGYTNSNGIYVFEWDTATAGTATLTVTKPNYSSYQGNVTFSDTTSAFTLANATAFDQLSSGSDYTLPISIINNQYSSLTNVTATFSSLSEYATVSMGNLTYSNMVLNQTAASQQNAAFTISDACPQGAELSFCLHIQGTYNTEQITSYIYFQVNEQGPDLSILSLQMGTDNVLTPGENSQMTLTLKNTGTVTATSISAHINCTNPGITISQATQTFNNLNADQTTTNTTPFMIAAAASVYPGTPITITAEMSYNNGAAQILTYDVVVGNVQQNSMTGPDDYGYICVANSDSHPLAMAYNWIELNPSLSGTGTEIILTDNDTEGSGTWSTITLPFTFKFYGVNYTQLTVCSNGFIMPGSEGSQEWMNWEIPGPMVPRPIIAPFWDDLIIQTDSKIYYKYNTSTSQFIIEYYKMKNKYNISAMETFEVVIYNNAANATPTGDNALLFQYKTFNNVDAGSYGVDYVDHGQYASVGIADHTGLNGIGYTYQNVYPATATTITNNSTLFFSTILNQATACNPQYQSFQFAETTPVFANNQIDAGETISITPTIVNSGTAAMASSSLILTCSDANVSIVNGTSTLNALNPEQNLAVNTPFQIHISSNCPNLRELTFDLQITAQSVVYHTLFSLIVHAPQVSFSNFLLNDNSAYYLDSGLSMPASLQINNLSNLPLNNATFNMQNSSDWSANPNQLNVSIPAFGSANLTFNLTASAGAQLGSVTTFSGLFNLTGIYDSLFTRQLYIGHFDAVASQNFDTQSYQDWSLSTGITVQATNQINQTGSELVIAPVQNTNGYVIVTPNIVAYDSQVILLSFRYLNTNPNSLSNVLFTCNETNVWQSVYNFSTIQDSVTTANCVISSLPVNIHSIKIKWQTTLQNFNPAPIYLDDISISAIHHPVGFVSGNVNLDNFVQNVTQVNISAAAYPDIVVHPDQSGNYVLPLYQGTYPLILAKLEHYLPQSLTNVNVVSSQTSGNNDFNLAYMRKPVQVSDVVFENELILHWQLEPLSDKAGRVEPDYYRIYLMHNNITTEDTTSALSYHHIIETGTYQVYLKSVYHAYDSSVCLSDSSAVLTINNTANGDNHLTPVVFELKQNYPNPFNPRTYINYSLNKAQPAYLAVYNLKGEVVRTLLNKTQSKGSYQVEFDGLDDNAKPLSSGVYFYKLVSGNQTVIRKMILLK